MWKCLVVLFFFGLLPVSVNACFPHIPKEEVQKENALADKMLKDKDVQGLIGLLEDSNYLLEQRAAMHLAELRAKDALKILRAKDLGYHRNSTISLGAFHVAITVIENDSRKSRIKELITTAKTSFRDVKDVESHYKVGMSRIDLHKSLTSEMREKSTKQVRKDFEEAKRCVLKGEVYRNGGYERKDAAGEYLLKYADDSVVKQLKPIRSYGAQYTVLAYRCRKLKKEQAIDLCLEILGKHETPQKAESAQRVLSEFGRAALDKVRRLKEKHEKIIDAPPPPFSIHHTIVSRCKRIISGIEKDVEKKE